MMHRYVYLGDRLTDPRLVGQPCDPVFRTTGKREVCVVGSGKGVPHRHGVVKLHEAPQALATPTGLYTTSPSREIVMPGKRTTLCFAVPRLLAGGL